VPRDEHREDREHLLEDRGIEASGLRCLPGDLAAYVLRAEQAPQQLIAKAGVSGVGADDIIDEPRATQRLDLRRETCRFNRGRRLAVDTADERGKKSLRPALGIFARNAKLLGQGVEASFGKQIGKVHVTSPVRIGAGAALHQGVGIIGQSVNRL
jgi:hypothetical protein